MNPLAIGIITLTCPSCSAKLKLVDSISLLVCGGCGNELMVRRSGDTIYLAPIAQGIKEMQVDTDNANAELAVTQLENEIKALYDELATVMARTNNHWLGASAAKASLFLGVLFAVLALGGLSRQLWTGAILFGTLSIGACFSMFIFHADRQAEINSLRGAEIERINEGLTEKKKQLHHNRQIANS